MAADHFSAICALFDGFELCKLWICGDSKMLHLLRASVTRFDVVFAPWERSSFPKLVSVFPRLEHFLLRNEAGSTFLHDFNLRAIPKTTDHIDLWFANDFVKLSSRKARSYFGT